MKLSRRSLLRGAGGVGVGLPFLEATMGRAWAAPVPLRLVIVVHHQGTVMNEWLPGGTGSNFTLPPLLAPLQPFKSKLNVWSGIDNKVRSIMRSNGHNAAGRSLLNAHEFVDPNNEGSMGKGPSIDQVVAQRLKAGTPMQSLELQVVGGVGEKQMIFSAPGVRVTGINDPRAAWTRITRVLPNSGGTPVPAPNPSLQDLLAAKRTPVIDAIRDNFKTVRGNLGREDRDRLDAHVARIEEMEKGLSPLMPSAASMGPACQRVEQGVPTSGYQPTDGRRENLSAAAQIDNIVMALSCNVTPVVTLQFTNYHAPTFDWLNLGLSGNWHDRVHNKGGNNVAGMVRAFRWYSDMVAELCRKMDAVNEGDRTLLDNSLVLWLSEFGDGAGHYTAQLPVVLIGGLGGRLKTDRHLRFTGRPHNDLFTTILNLFGFEDRSFGHPSFNNGPLPIG